MLDFFFGKPIDRYIPIKTFSEFNTYVNGHNLLIFPLPFEKVMLHYLSFESSMVSNDPALGVSTSTRKRSYYVTSRSTDFNRSLSTEFSIFGELALSVSPKVRRILNRDYVNFMPASTFVEDLLVQQNKQSEGTPTL